MLRVKGWQEKGGTRSGPRCNGSGSGAPTAPFSRPVRRKAGKRIGGKERVAECEKTHVPTSIELGIVFHKGVLTIKRFSISTTAPNLHFTGKETAPQMAYCPSPVTGHFGTRSKKNLA